MASVKFIFASACLIVVFQQIYGHGHMSSPPSRSFAWKLKLGTPENYNFNEIFCGGMEVQKNNKGKCGACGDNWANPQPRANENGGTYGTGKIVETYQKGQQMTVNVTLTANHMGHFEFAVCPLNGPKDVETEACFKKHPVKLASGGYKFPIKTGMTNLLIPVILPAGLTCKQCSFRWHYRGGNNWGSDKNGQGLGHGPQETFRNCADITIS